MSITCPNVPELIPVAIGNVIQMHTTAQYSAYFGAGNVKTPTAPFSAQINGHTLSFRKGIPFVITAAMLIALTAQIAPII